MEKPLRAVRGVSVCGQVLPSPLSVYGEEYRAYAKRAWGVADATLDDYWYYVGRFFEVLNGMDAVPPLAELSAERIQQAVFAFGETHGPGARRWMLHGLRSFFRFCHLRGYTDRDYSMVVPGLHERRLAVVPKAIEASAAGALQAAVDARGMSGLRDAAIIGLLNSYGVRGVQLRRLRLDDVDWEHSRIRFAAAKGGLAIELPLLPEAGNRLLAYLLQARPATNCREFFVGRLPPHGPLGSAAAMSAVVRRRLRQAGIRLAAGTSCGTHGFRHAFASRLIGRVPLKHLSDLMGHRDPDSTLIYGKVAFRQLQSAALPWPAEVQS